MSNNGVRSSRIGPMRWRRYRPRRQSMIPGSLTGDSCRHTPAWKLLSPGWPPGNAGIIVTDYRLAQPIAVVRPSPRTRVMPSVWEKKWGRGSLTYR